ncbi:MAG TPA: YoaK family protein [Candidatus Sulfotelmatobacter sp.]
MQQHFARFHRNITTFLVHRKAGSIVQGVHQTARSKVKSGVALMLTFSAGMVDIVGYIGVYHWFVAHMTGDTVHLGNQLATGKWSDAEKAGTIIGSFILGSILGRAVIEAGARKQQRAVASVTLLAEAALIFTFICIRSFAVSAGAIPVATLLVLLALLAGAMGLQTATLTKIGPLTIHTTFVTGMLNKFAEAISEWFFWLYDERKTGKAWQESTQHRAFRNARFMALIWFSYMLGSLFGTWTYSHWTVWVLYVPVATLLISAGIDQWRPLAIEEEKEQTQQ